MVDYYSKTKSSKSKRRTKKVPASQQALMGGSQSMKEQEMAQQGIGTKSCLAFRLPGTRNNNARGTEVSSQQSSNEKKGLLDSSHEHSWESFANQQVGHTSWDASTKTPSSWDTRTTTASSQQSPHPSTATSSSLDLLTPPPASDRSEQRRRQYENESRQRGGEMYEGEPAGRRGMEAPVVQPTTSPTPQNPLHLLNPPTPSDRSERRRLQYETEKRQGGMYEGEPIGRRGQEAAVQPQQPQASSRAQGVAPAPGPASLLTPPTPSDRRDRRRQRYESESQPDQSQLLGQPQQQQQSYQQLAAPPPPQDLTPRTANNAQGVRVVEPSTPKSQISGLTAAHSRNITPVSRMYSTDTSESDDSDVDIRNMRNDLLPVDENAPLQFSTETGQAVRLDTTGQPRVQQQSQPPVPPSRTDSDMSDRDLAYMRQDFMPSPVPLPQVQHQPLSRQPQQSQERGAAGLSPVAAAAAAAAASAGHSRVPGDELDDRAREIETAGTDNVDELNALAMDHVQAGEFDKALEYFARVLAIHQKRQGPVHAAVASSYHNLGTVHAKRAAELSEDSMQQLQCRAQALECFQAAARVARDSLGRDHPNVAVSLVRIGFLLLQSRQYQNAIVTFKEALRIRVSHYGANHGLVANLYNNMGVCHMHMGQFGEGREYLDSALGIQRHIAKETQGQEKRDRWINLLELADTLFNIGGLCLEWIRRQGPDARRAVDATNAFSEAYEIRGRVLGPKDPMVLQVKSLLDMAQALPRPKSRSVSPGRRRVDQEGYQSPNTPSRGRSVPPPGTAYRPMTTSSRGRSLTPKRDAVGDTNGYAVAEPPHVRRSVNTSGASLSPNRSQYQPSDESTGVDISLSIDESSGQRSSKGVSIFRPESADVSGQSSERSHRPAVVNDTAVSTKGDDNDNVGGNTQVLNKGKASTRIFVSPHLVPETSPTSRSRTRRENDSTEIITNSSFDDEPFIPDTSTEIAGSTSVIPKSFSYDAEENCLISDTGIDSEHGRVHYPLAWNKGGSDGNDRAGASTGRDIMVTRPYRDQSSANESPLDVSATSSNFSTGNKQRDEIMNRARVILDQHSDADGPPEEYTGIDEDEGVDESLDFGGGAPKVRTFDQDLLEDGVAPLGGKWPSAAENERAPKPTREMLEDPMNHVRELHDEATQLLQANDFIEALHLFEVVLECQRRRHGPLHPDVAAALHNVGIAQLRALNYSEALKAFEEAARVRKDSLGRDHPQVAVSLVKVGITLLLIHQFEDALWSFRQALAVRKAALGPLHPSTARIYNNIGCVHVEFNEFREARQAFESALDIQRNALSQDPDSGPLMFGAATTLCNLGYLYRYRDMHGKAALVLKEAVDLQESVLGRTHATVLSTLDNLADSCANGGHATDALKFYNMVLERFRVGGRSGSKKVLRAEAVLHYKMSRVHRHRNDRETQLGSLKLALRSVRAYSDSSSKDGQSGGQTDTLERRIQYDIRGAREQIEKEQLKWI